MAMSRHASKAVRLSVAGSGSEASLCEEVRARAAALGVRGWVRLLDDGAVSAHVEGASSAVDELIEWVGLQAGGGSLSERAVRVEGHEQFAIRGVTAGVFV